MEVQPVPESSFHVPEHDFEIDSEKIKKMTLDMNIKMPDWLSS